MKKLTLLTIAAVLSGSMANAQIQRGNVMVGGNFANLNLGLDDSKVFSLEITPKAAWFIQDNVALGGYIDLGLQTAKGSSTTFTYGAGALGRYYTGREAEVIRHGRIFVEATFGFGGINVSDGGGNTNGLKFGAGPGFAYFITPNIGLETLLTYNGLTGFGNASYQNNINLLFGLQIYLPGRATAAKVAGDVK